MYTGPDSNIRTICKGVLKQDENTKLKALEKLGVVIATHIGNLSSRDGPIDFSTFIPHWGFVYRRLCRDNSRRTRIALQRAHAAVASKNPKATRSVLSSIIGPLWASGSDPAYDVAVAAALALDATVPRDRRPQALRNHIASIMNYIRDLVNGKMANDDPGAANVKDKSKHDAKIEEEQRREMDACLGIAAVTQLLGSEGLQLEGNELAVDGALVDTLRIFSGSVSNYLKDSRPRVRKAAYGLLAMYASCCPSALSDNILLSSLELPGLETESSNLESVWIATMSILKNAHCCRRLETCQCQSLSPLEPLIKQLKGFFLLSAEACYPCLLPFLAKAPRSLLLQRKRRAGKKNGLKSSSKFEIADLVDAIWEGIRLQRATAPPVALSFAINAHAECAMYISEEIGVEYIQRAFAGAFKLSPAAAEIGLDELSKLLASFFKHGYKVDGEGEKQDPSSVLEESLWNLVNVSSINDHHLDGESSSGSFTDGKLSLSECIRCGNWVGRLLSSAIKWSANMDHRNGMAGRDSSMINTRIVTEPSPPSPTRSSSSSSSSIYSFCASLFWRCEKDLNPSRLAFMRHSVDVLISTCKWPEDVVGDLINHCFARLQDQKEGGRRLIGNNEESEALVHLVKSLSICLPCSEQVQRLCQLVAVVPKGEKWTSRALCWARSVSISCYNNDHLLDIVKESAEEALTSEELTPDVLQTCIGVRIDEVGGNRVNIDDDENGCNISLVSFSSVKDAISRCPKLVITLLPALIHQHKESSLRLPPPSLLKRLAPYLLHIVFSHAFLHINDDDERCGVFRDAWDSYTTSTATDDVTWNKFIELVIADLSLFHGSNARSGGTDNVNSSAEVDFLPLASAAAALHDMLMVELCGNAPNRVLHIVGVTNPETWRRDTTGDGCGNHHYMWLLTREILDGFSSQQERLSLLQKASVNRLEFLECLIFMLQAGEADNSAASLLVPPGDLELSRIWKCGLDSLARKVEWWSKNQLENARVVVNDDDEDPAVTTINNLTINAEGLGLLGSALERESIVLHHPLPVRRPPFARFDKMPTIGTEALYVESSVSVQRIKIVGVHQDPDEGQQPYVTIMPLNSQQSYERQTTLSRLRKPQLSNSENSSSYMNDGWGGGGGVVYFGMPEPVRHVIHVDVTIELWYTTILPLLRETGRRILESFSPFDVPKSAEFLEDTRIVIPILRNSAKFCIHSALLSQDSEVQTAVAESFTARGLSAGHFCATIGSVCAEWLGILETSAQKLSETRMSCASKNYFVNRASISAEIISVAFTNTLAIVKMLAVPSLSAMKIVLSTVVTLASGDDFFQGEDCQIFEVAIRAALLLVKSIAESIRTWEWKGEDFSLEYSSVESLIVLCTELFSPNIQILFSGSHFSSLAGNSTSVVISNNNSSIGDSITLLLDVWTIFLKCSSNREAVSLQVLSDIAVLAAKLLVLHQEEEKEEVYLCPNITTQFVIGIAEVSYGLSCNQRRAIWLNVVKDEGLLDVIVDKALLKEPSVVTLPAVAVLSAAVPALLALSSDEHNLNSISPALSSACEKDDVYLSKDQQAEKDCEIVRESLPYVVMRVIEYFSSSRSSEEATAHCTSSSSRGDHNLTTTTSSNTHGYDDDDRGGGVSSNVCRVWRKNEEWVNYFTSTHVNPDLSQLVLQRWSPDYCGNKEQEERISKQPPFCSSSTSSSPSDFLDSQAFLVLQRWSLAIEILNSTDGLQNIKFQSEVRLAFSGIISHRKLLLAIFPLCFSSLQVCIYYYVTRA